MTDSSLVNASHRQMKIFSNGRGNSHLPSFPTGKKMKKINRLKSLVVTSILLSCGLSGTASATTLFADDFQGNLSQWNTGSSAVIVSDPLVPGGRAVEFTVPRGGGDLYSKNTFASSTAGNFILSYDYLGLGAGGGFVGIRTPGETWLAGDGSYPTPFHNPDTGAWEHVSFAFNSSLPVTLEIEQYSGKNNTPRQALFKDLVLTDANGATVAAVPEPETYALLLAGLGAMGFVARRRKSL